MNKDIRRDLTREKQKALLAYRDGRISLGKLAEAMGMHVLALRVWLREHEIPQNSEFGIRDDANA
ncbi:MAG: UPF0175 family protein [Candidatus Sumerlaeota bacterium]|nr:UPF0175 family protein [Candidatus Sumerlaeota bacterium]